MFNEEALEEEIEAFIGFLENEGIFKDKNTKIPTSCILDDGTLKLIMSLYGPDSRVVTIIDKYLYLQFN